MEDSEERDRGDSSLSKSAHIRSPSRQEESTETDTVSAASSKHNSAISEYQDISCQDFRRTSSSLSPKQHRLLRQWYQDFAHPDVAPDLSEASLAGFATAIQTRKELIADYIEQRREGSDTSDNIPDFDPIFPNVRRSTEPANCSSQPYTLSSANSHLPPHTLTLVEKYVSACRRRRSQNDGRRSVNTGPYRCTFGCGYRTKRVFDWRRHEETHEPQELWLCSICAGADINNPFLVNRKDKFLKHAADKHTHMAADMLLEKGKVPFVPRKELQCPTCGEDSGNWDERCRHVLGHFEDEVERAMKRVKIVQEEDDDDDDGQGVVVESVTSGTSVDERRASKVENID
jgi:hypothetical protein